MSNNRCSACGSYGSHHLGNFVSDDLVRAANLRKENDELKAQIKELNKLLEQRKENG